MSSIPEVLKRTGNEPPRKTSTPVRELCKTAVDAVLDKKAKDVLVMDMSGVSGVADMFLICTGESDQQIKAVADGVSDAIRESHEERPWHKEGYEHRQWILLDYVDLVVHVFSAERREFYSLERLWGDAPRAEVDPMGTAADVQLLDEAPQ
jgi:ribosome-associated protein